MSARAASDARRREGMKAEALLSTNCQRILKRASDHFDLSRRGQAGVVAVATTISDVDGSKEVREEHLLEAIAHRSFLEGADNHPALSW